jgi:hypothetical protein
MFIDISDQIASPFYIEHPATKRKEKETLQGDVLLLQSRRTKTNIDRLASKLLKSIDVGPNLKKPHIPSIETNPIEFAMGQSPI